MAAPLVSVVVVCWNAKQHLKDCLESLHRQTYPSLEVIVVDNGSTDGTREYVESMYPWVRVHALDTNTGYAPANNLGFRLAEGEYLVVLNPDTEVEPDFAGELVRAVEQDGVGLATSRIRLFDDRAHINACGNEIHLTGLGTCRGLGRPSGDFDHPAMVASVSGCAFMIRRDVLDKVGGLDEDYFLYVEDTDLSLRARLAGYRIAYAPKSIVYHKYALRMTAQKFHLIERNRRLTLVKNFRWGTLLALLPSMVLTGLLMWTYAVMHGPKFFLAKVQAHVWIWRNWSLVLEKRRRTQVLRHVPDREVVRLLSSALPPDQVIGPGLFGRVAGVPMNLAYRLLAIPVRIFG